MQKIKELLSRLFSGVLSFFRGVPAGAVAAAGSRQARYGGISFAALVVMVGILVLANLIVRNAGWRWDLTKNKLFSLSPETLRVLKDIKEDTKATVFISSAPQMSGQKEEIRRLLDEYHTRNPKIKVEYVDPYAQQALALKYGVQRQGTIVFAQGSRTEVTTNATEQDFTSALIKLKNPNKVKVVFWTGNGERDPEQMDDEGYSEIKSTLEKLNYTVTKQDVAKDATIASDTGVLVVAGPRNPLVSRYTDALDQYLLRGGRMLVMFETLQNFQQTGLEPLLGKYGITIKQGAVIDPELFFDNPGIPGVAEYPTHLITERLDRTVYINPIQVAPSKTVPDGMEVDSIIKTSSKSWLETSMTDQNPKLDPNSGDVAGPVDIGVAMKYKDPGKDQNKQTRIVAIGDADSGSNMVVRFEPQKQIVVPGNLDLIVNSINWLGSREDLISITPKDTTTPTMSLSDQQTKQLQYFVMFIMPLLFLVIAVVVWRGRKRLRG